MKNRSLSSLLSKRVVFVSGKGGVGKTTVSTALGLAAAAENKKTLVVELDTEGNIPALLGEKGVFETPIELLPNFYTVSLQPEKALREYVLLKLKFQSLYKIIFQNRMIRFFINAVPGLNELLLIGKIWHLHNQTDKNGLPLYDIIIVDAPATGHGISFLQVPRTVINIVRIGPINEDAQKVEKLLTNPKETVICLVTLPEEMPVNEAIEFYQAAETSLKLPVPVTIVNKMLPELFTTDDLRRLKNISPTNNSKLLGDIKECANFLQARRGFCLGHLERLKSKLKQPVITLPFIFTEDFGRSHTIQLATILAESEAAA